MECPKCGREMEHIDEEPDVGIIGGWDCECGHTVADWEWEDREPVGE